MLSKINLSLYKSLLYCDFFFIKQNFYQSQKKRDVFLKRFKAYNIVNVWTLVKNFKRLFLVVKFVLIKQFNRMIINFNNSFNYELAQFFFTTYPLKAPSKVVSLTESFQMFNVQSCLQRHESSSFYCLMGQSAQILSKQAQKLVNSDVLLTSILSFQRQVLHKGFYNIQVDFNDFKKFLFLLLFLNKIVKRYT